MDCDACRCSTNAEFRLADRQPEGASYWTGTMSCATCRNKWSVKVPIGSTNGEGAEKFPQEADGRYLTNVRRRELDEKPARRPEVTRPLIISTDAILVDMNCGATTNCDGDKAYQDCAGERIWYTCKTCHEVFKY